MRIIGVSAAAFLVALLTLVLIPRETRRVAARLLRGTEERPDTAAMRQRLTALNAQLAPAQLALDRRRNRARYWAEHPAVLDSLLAAAAGSPNLVARRDSLTAAIAELASLRARAERAPLPASYQALANARELHGDPAVRALLDSLTDVARARAAVSAGGGVDPIFVALTTRLTRIGRSIVARASAREAALRAERASLGPAPTEASSVLAAGDTTASRMRVDSLNQQLRAAATQLILARHMDSALDDRANRARDIASTSAPPLALIAAALVLGLAVGFVVTLAFELRTPRVADAAEATRVTGVSTLAVIAPRPPDPQRMRRAADRQLSPLISVNNESYRYVFLSVSGADAVGALGFPLVAVTGDEAEIVATVAINIAVACVHDSRSALLIDADTDAALVAEILGVPRGPGVADVLAGRVDWAAVVGAATVGRDRMLNVIPAGSGVRRRTPFEALVAIGRSVLPEGNGHGEEGGGMALEDEQEGRAARLRGELRRLGGRYDLTVVTAPAGAAQVGPESILPLSETILCARVAFTTLSRLARAVATLRDSGLTVRGIVLWDADAPPRLEQPERVS